MNWFFSDAVAYWFLLGLLVVVGLIGLALAFRLL